MSGGSSRPGGTGRCAEPRTRTTRVPPTTAVPSGCSPPVLQMYDSPDLVNVFLADPQRRLVFDPDTDEVWDIAAGGLGTFPQRNPTRPPQALPGHPPPALPGGLLCALQRRGVPPVSGTDGICQVGLVVRRRRLDLPGGPQGEVARALRQHAAARASAPQSSAGWRRCGAATAARCGRPSWTPASAR